MTAVVAIMKNFCKNFSNSQNASSRRKSIKSNNRLNSKKKHRISAKLHQIGLDEPAKDASEGLIVKEKTIRVLLDTGSSGDLLFIRKGSQKYIPYTKRAAPNRGALPMAPFKPKRWVISTSPLKSTP